MTEVLDRDSAVPLHVQLAELIRAKLTRGEWTADEKIPSENEFNQIYGISRMTARLVLARLVDEGLLFRVQGKGTFVSRSKISTRSPTYMGIREQLEQQGYATTTKVLTASIVLADGRIAGSLDVTPGTEVWHLTRLRTVDGVPISLHESYVPRSLATDLPDHDLIGQQLCTLLEGQFGLHMTHVTETLETASASKEQAQNLHTAPGSPILRLEQKIRNENGTAFEFARIHFRSDMIRLEFSYDL